MGTTETNYYIKARMTMIIDTLDDMEDDFDDSDFCDEKQLYFLVETLKKGCDLCLTRMQQLTNEDPDCEC